MSFFHKNKEKENFVGVRDDQDVWFFFFSILFLLFTAFLIWVLFEVNGSLPVAISFFDGALIALAVFRLTRLFVYDAITKFVRNWFLVKKEDGSENGISKVELYEPEGGAKKTVRHLLGCPWCVAVWFAVLVVFFYFLTPIAWIVIFMLAVAGVASLLQIFANFLGWGAELGKQRVLDQKEKNK